MRIHFKPLLTTAIEHDYFAGECREVDFVVPASVQEVLRRARMMARTLNGRLHLMYEADDGNAPIASIAGESLLLGVRFTHPYFANVTTLPALDAGHTALYANATATGALDAAQGVLLTAGRHTHHPQESARPVTLRLTSGAGALLDTRTLVAGQDDTSYDFTAFAAGAYSISEDYGGGQVRVQRVLIERDLREANLQAVLAIKIDASFYAAPPAFALDFSARQETLKYYVVARNYSLADFNQLSVEDAGFEDEARPQITFKRVAVEDFTAADLATELLHDGSARVALFESLIPVARRERGPRKLHLNRNGSVLIEHLPLPGPERSTAQLVVHLSKP